MQSSAHTYISATALTTPLITAPHCCCIRITFIVQSHNFPTQSMSFVGQTSHNPTHYCTAFTLITQHHQKVHHLVSFRIGRNKNAKGGKYLDYPNETKSKPLTRLLEVLLDENGSFSMQNQNSSLMILHLATIPACKQISHECVNKHKNDAIVYRLCTQLHHPCVLQRQRQTMYVLRHFLGKFHKIPSSS